MFGKGSKLYSIRKFKCPKCHEGDLYKAPLSAFKGIYNMHEECSHCHQKFNLEPGFYWGAMYIGYGFSSAYMLSTMTLMLWLTDLSINQSFGIAVVGAIFIVPIIARLARAVWINIYIGYNPPAKKSV